MTISTRLKESITLATRGTATGGILNADGRVNPETYLQIWNQLSIPERQLLHMAQLGSHASDLMLTKLVRAIETTANNKFKGLIPEEIIQALRAGHHQTRE